MARNNGKRSSGMRNMRSAGWTAAKFTGRTTEKAAVGLFRWAATDHTGLSRALEDMPEMGFLASLKHILVQFLITMVGVVVAGGLDLCPDRLRNHLLKDYMLEQTEARGILGAID